MKNRRLFTFCFLLLSTGMSAQVFTVDTIAYNGNPNNRINLLIMGDGYTTSEMGTFRSNAQGVANHFFSVPPLSRYRDFFNFFGIEVVSNESGTDHPETAADCNIGSQPITLVDNYLETTFDYNGTHRCIYSSSHSLIYSIANTNFPLYDYINVIVNTSYYGGCAGGIAFTSMNSSSAEVFVHEFGHMFGELADEYSYGGSSCNPGFQQRINVSQISDPLNVVWKDWLTSAPIPTPAGTNCSLIGIYEGARYCAENWYRPKCNCKMRSNNQSFCEVCTEQLIYKVNTMVNYIDAYSPLNTGTLEICGNSKIDFSADVLNSTNNTIRSRWYINNSIVLNNGTDYTMDGALFSPGMYEVKLVAADTTVSVKRPMNNYQVVWNVQVIPSPSANISTTDSTVFCEGDSALIQAITDSSYVYQWFMDNQVINASTSSQLCVQSSGIYSLVTSIGACRDTSPDIGISVLPNPPAMIGISGDTIICAGESVNLFAQGCTSCSYQWKMNQSDLFGEISDAYTANQSGFYQVNVLDTISGCHALTREVMVNVHAMPSVQISVSGPVEFCAGDSVVLSVPFSAGLNYLWQENGIPVPGETFASLTIHSQGSYTVFVTDSICSDSSDSVIVQVYSLPVVSLLSLPDTLCISSSSIVLSGLPSGGIYSGAGVIDSLFYPALAGSGLQMISYTYTDSNFCTASIDKAVFVEICTDIKEESFEHSFYVFPNPVSELLHIRYPILLSDDVSFRIFDITGRVMDWTASGKEHGYLQIDIGSWSKGVYFLQMISGSGRNSRMFVIAP